MTSLADFTISRITPEQVSSVKYAEKLVDVFRAATNDGIYDKLGASVAGYLQDLVRYNSSILQVARLGADDRSYVVGFALFKLRFKGWRDPYWEFTSSSQQTELQASIFAAEGSTLSPVTREFTGDPVLQGFSESLKIDGQTFSEIDEDLLTTVLEPVYILPQYQHIDGLARALVQPIMKHAVANHIKVIAYNRLKYHDYSLPQKISASFKPLYNGSRVKIRVDTRETPGWTGPEIIWNQEFQLFSTGHGQDDPYPTGALEEWR
ncbi:hypothetical protein BKA67DRAFT_344883 [Truncatella angustata]|uniref:Uncharacterized protein n=1 Tax=Truncatella angustata TaxID=152316 RepID=A0A9P8ZWJ9_9PEZI|nr:uncharacterized protein BKA67DRAFT_344883 [Truncatella angustata]KAH6652038.1 hypothetical protein BKA67DRAFT_344883 [Truncatella angustata]